jgi:hypothetical protein
MNFKGVPEKLWTGFCSVNFGLPPMGGEIFQPRLVLAEPVSVDAVGRSERSRHSGNFLRQR